MKLKEHMKIYMAVIKDKAEYLVENHKKKLIKAGAIILAVITIGSSVLVVFRMASKPKINNKPAEIVEVKDGKGKTNLFLEHVEQLKSGIYDVSALVFGEENMRINETYGESGKDYVVMQGNFKIKYSIDITRIRVDYNFDKEEVILKVPKDAVGVDSVEPVGDFTQLERHTSWQIKMIDWLSCFNNDEELKEGAIRQLLRNSKIEAQKYNQSALQVKADKALKELVDTINLNGLKYKIEFVDNVKINIKK
jgi:hypothetical protein